MDTDTTPYIPTVETETISGYMGASTGDMLRRDRMTPSLEQPLVLNDE